MAVLDGTHPHAEKESLDPILDAKTEKSLVYEWGEDPTNTVKGCSSPHVITSLQASSVSALTASALSTVMLTRE